MAEDGRRDYFGADVDDDLEDDDLLTAPIVVPVKPAEPLADEGDAAEPAEEPAPVDVAEIVAPPPTAPQAQVPPVAAVPVESPLRPPAGVAAQVMSDGRTREQRLGDALNALMGENPDIEASALVSLDGFTMASALPADMQEDRVGAMSAAILGLGERASAELGRGVLDQVFIEGSHGIVVLISAGGLAVLTALAGPEARLGLVLYDMRAAADEIAAALG